MKNIKIKKSNWYCLCGHSYSNHNTAKSIVWKEICTGEGTNLECFAKFPFINAGLNPVFCENLCNKFRFHKNLTLAMVHSRSFSQQAIQK